MGGRGRPPPRGDKRSMTLEELLAGDSAAKRMQTVSAAVEELLVAAQRQDRLTVGVYEAAKLMNVDPDCVQLCVLASDEDPAQDVGLQLQFTLLQAFCHSNEVQLLRVAGMQRLAQLLGEAGTAPGAPPSQEVRDLHCLLVTSPLTDGGSLGLLRVTSLCRELLGCDQGVPSVSLER